METEEIITLYNYNRWATEKILESAAKLNSSQFVEKNSCSHGSLRGLLVHILSAEQIWRLRCQEGISPGQFIDENLFPALSSLWKCFTEEQNLTSNYLAALDVKQLHKTIVYRTTKGTECRNVLWHVLLHLINHGTHHRSEIAELLSRYGSSPGDLDFILYLRNLDA